jgi:predicted nucleic acid-binding protein
MTTEYDWVILDTNVWIFGLRNQPDRPACNEILRRLNRLYVRIPRQILMELRANLNKEEMNVIPSCKSLSRSYRYSVE